MLTDKQQEAVKAYFDAKQNEVHAAKALGIDRCSLRMRLWGAAKAGWPVPADTFCEQAPPGFEMTHGTLHVVGDEVKQSWPRIKRIPQAFNLDYFNDRIPAALPAPGPPVTNSDLMLEWIIPDHHQGMFTWAKEAGFDYDSKIARDLMIAAAVRIVARTGPVKKAVICGIGDTTHANNKGHTTSKGKHILDVDTRFQKTIDIAVETWCTSIDIHLQNAEEVEIVNVPGNHDDETSYMLTKILAAYYRNDSRVVVDTQPSKHKYYRWGSTLFMYSHGDTGLKRLAPKMKAWAVFNDQVGIRRMYVRKGHFHKRGRDFPAGLLQDDGVIIETFPTMAPNDAWAEEEAYVNLRATVANLWHVKYGQRMSMELGVDELMEGVG